MNLLSNETKSSNSIKNSNDDQNDQNDQNEIMSTVLALLGSIIELGILKRDEKEEQLLRSIILPSLQKIASCDKDLSLSENASDVALMIMVRGKTDKLKEKNTSKEIKNEGNFI